MTATVIVRWSLVALGMVTMIAGLGAIVGLTDGAGPGLWLVAVGAFLVVVPVLERQRYRSEAAEKGSQAPGPGGGEAGAEPLDPRFRPTAEVFIDPTSGRRMRVVIDPATGDRRYVAEG